MIDMLAHLAQRAWFGTTGYQGMALKYDKILCCRIQDFARPRRGHMRGSYLCKPMLRSLLGDGFWKMHVWEVPNPWDKNAALPVRHIVHALSCVERPATARPREKQLSCE